MTTLTGCWRRRQRPPPRPSPCFALSPRSAACCCARAVAVPPRGSAAMTWPTRRGRIRSAPRESVPLALCRCRRPSGVADDVLCRDGDQQHAVSVLIDHGRGGKIRDTGRPRAPGCATTPSGEVGPYCWLAFDNDPEPPTPGSAWSARSARRVRRAARSGRRRGGARPPAARPPGPADRPGLMEVLRVGRGTPGFSRIAARAIGPSAGAEPGSSWSRACARSRWRPVRWPFRALLYDAERPLSAWARTMLRDMAALQVAMSRELPAELGEKEAGPPELVAVVGCARTTTWTGSRPRRRVVPGQPNIAASSARPTPSARTASS